MNIYEQQFLCPTNFPNGINVGNFNVVGQLTNGLPAGLVQPYLVSPTAAYSEFLSDQVPANSTIYVNLSDFKDAATNKFRIVNNPETNPGLLFDCERGFSINLKKQGSVLISGYDRYEQQMTWGDSFNADETKPVSRAFNKIASIKITNDEATPMDYNFQTDYTVGLPYNALEGIIPLVVNIESTNNFKNILLYQTEAPGFAIQKFYTYNETETETLSEGRARPTVNVSPGALNNFYDFDGSKILSVWQLVYGAGTLPHYLQDRTSYALKLNSLETVIGVPPFKEGWIGWQG